MQWNLVKNNYQHIKSFITFVSNKQLTVDKYFTTSFNNDEYWIFLCWNWFTDQASKALEIEDNVNLTLIIG